MTEDNKIDWAAVAEKRRAPKGECKTCDDTRERGETHFPDHYASMGCKSGKHPHCTCDTCF